MSSKSGQPYDADSPRFTREMMKRSLNFEDLPPALQEALGPGDDAKSSLSKPVPIFLSKDIVDALQASGSDWQIRVDQHLREWLSQEAVLKKAG